MTDVSLRIEGQAGRITLNRPKALNALSYQMCLEIETALDEWRDDDAVKVIVIDAEGARAFCAGGDIAELYTTGRAGNFAYGRRFWADEYRLNAKIFDYPKPVVSFLQGFTMGGGVGLGCHGTHRIVGESSQIAMPECGIGLMPDVGGTLMLALAPGRLGEYLGTTGTRMGADDAIYAGFADGFIPQDQWPRVIAALEQSGDVAAVTEAICPPPPGQLRGLRAQIDQHFAGETLTDVRNSLTGDHSAFASAALGAMDRGSPLAMAATIEALHRLRGPSLSMTKALELEYRFSWRAMEHGDFLEGIRAAIIDKDRSPKWQFAGQDVPTAAVARMLAPLGRDALSLEDKK